jgi:hypothetical protein
MKRFSQLLAFVCLTFLSLKTYSQGTKTTSTVSFKFENYSVEQDKIVRHKLSAYHFYYTCIPAGIVMINLNEKQSITKLKEELDSGGTKLSYTTIDIKMEEAEKTCSTFRSSN